MAWNLTEKEQNTLIQAAEDVLNPYRRALVGDGYLLNNTLGFDEEAPEEIKQLREVIDNITFGGFSCL
jgi:hypothetical protein